MKKMGFGLMRLPLAETGNQTAVDFDQVCRMADMFMARGYNYFDTAATYHGRNSEIAFRKAVAERYPRESFVITDKLSFWIVKKEEDFRPFFSGQLERLSVDYIDNYFIHAINESTYKLAEKTHAFDFLKELKESGKVKRTGISYHDNAQLLDRILTEHPEIETVQLQINYLDWEDERIQSRKCYEICVKHNKPVVVMEPVKGGALANVCDTAKEKLALADSERTPVQWALDFAAGFENVVTVLSGASSIEQMEQNIRTFEKGKKLSAEQLDTLAEVAQIVRMDTAVPCTSCRYCEKDCPKNIPIADYFGIYNGIRNTTMNSTMLYYQSLSANKGKASDCIDCGLCEKSCPQHLEVRKHLKDVAKVFDK